MSDWVRKELEELVEDTEVRGARGKKAEDASLEKLEGEVSAMADSFTLLGGDDISLRYEVMSVVVARKNDVS